MFLKNYFLKFQENDSSRPKKKSTLIYDNDILKLLLLFFIFQVGGKLVPRDASNPFYPFEIAY